MEPMESPGEPMGLTEPQRRTLEELIRPGSGRRFPLDLPERLRGLLEDRLRALTPDFPLADALWMGKELLRDPQRCEGLFAAKLAGEDTAFVHSTATAAGVLLHKAVEMEVGAREERDPEATLTTAVERIVEREERFADHWTGLEPVDQDEVLMESVRRVTLFRASFPPLKPLRAELTPISEMGVRAEFLEGDLVCSGRIDLVLGAPDRSDPSRATRLAIDLKTGSAWPGHAQDMRFYALLMTLRFGVPPYRVASLYLESGGWQAEDVSEELLERTAEDVAEAVRIAAELSAGRDPVLRPGPHCGWCPRAETCPEVDIAG